MGSRVCCAWVLAGLWGLSAGCAQPRTPPAAAATPEAGVVAAPAPGPKKTEELQAAAASAWDGRESPGAASRAAQAFEELAARSEQPSAALLEAARARRFVATALAQGPWLVPGEAPDGAGPGRGGQAQVELEAREEAKACANDARAAWTGRSQAVRAALESGAALEGLLATVPARSAEALYLDAACTALWARLSGFVALAERQAELRQLLQRAADLAPGLDQAGPDRELGQLLAQLPAYAGGDLAAARQRFEQSLARAPGSLVTRVLFARSVAVKLQDGALFSRLLGEALALPARTPEERAARAEAAALLARKGQLFGG